MKWTLLILGLLGFLNAMALAGMAEYADIPAVKQLQSGMSFVVSAIFLCGVGICETIERRQ